MLDGLCQELSAIGAIRPLKLRADETGQPAAILWQRRRQTLAGTAARPVSEADDAPAPSTFINPASVPDEYAMRVRGDCLAPAIKAGDAVPVDKRQPYSTGDLVYVFLKPECSGAAQTSA